MERRIQEIDEFEREINMKKLITLEWLQQNIIANHPSYANLSTVLQNIIECKVLFDIQIQVRDLRDSASC